MAEYTVSADGTSIAFERFGTGAPIVLLGGMFCDRATHRPLAVALARQLTAVTVDRRGRGDSGDTPPYSVEREIEDVQAVIRALGGSASVYGHSSGAGLAFRAAAAGLPVDRLILHEPPFGGDDDASRRDARSLASSVRTAIEENRPADAIRSFLAGLGTPPEAADAMASDPAMLRLAPTMPYDHAVMGDEDDGGAIPLDVARSITVPTLVLAGSASPDFFRHAAERLAHLIPGARYAVIQGQDHGAPAAAVAPFVEDLVASA